MTLEQLVQIMDRARDLGDAVFDQLKDTVGENAEPFHKQNPNAIELIVEFLHDNIDPGTFEDDEIVDDVMEYVAGWETYKEDCERRPVHIPTK